MNAEHICPNYSVGIPPRCPWCGQPNDRPPLDAPPAGRPRRRGVRRVRRDVTLDGPVVERVEQLAHLEHGGNFSAALQAVVEAGLASGSVAERLAAATAEVDRLTR